jgi:hypothetical protein
VCETQRHVRGIPGHRCGRRPSDHAERALTSGLGLMVGRAAVAIVPLTPQKAGLGPWTAACGSSLLPIHLGMEFVLREALAGFVLLAMNHHTSSTVGTSPSSHLKMTPDEGRSHCASSAMLDLASLSHSYSMNSSVDMTCRDLIFSFQGTPLRFRTALMRKLHSIRTTK